jgi:regulator of PEP synthase PpsR (kinase-PPPase family)
MLKPKLPTILVVSDGRGETGAQVVNAAIVQFQGLDYQVVRRGHVRTARRVRAIMRKAAELQAVVFYTLVADETRHAIAAAAAELLLPTVDILGPAFSALNDLFKTAPAYRPGLLYAAEREKIDRLEAIDYTLKHDDGQHLQDLDDADVVLVGVSRSSKTSTCFYLAYEGVKAANVPIVPEVPVPEELGALDPAKVVGLRVNVMRLVTVREARAKDLPNTPLLPYLDREAIVRELRHANRLMDERRWRSFDASYMAIEEIAKEVMRLRGLTGLRRRMR